MPQVRQASCEKGISSIVQPSLQVTCTLQNIPGSSALLHVGVNACCPYAGVASWCKNWAAENPSLVRNELARCTDRGCWQLIELSFWPSKTCSSSSRVPLLILRGRLHFPSLHPHVPLCYTQTVILLDHSTAPVSVGYSTCTMQDHSENRYYWKSTSERARSLSQRTTLLLQTITAVHFCQAFVNRL